MKRLLTPSYVVGGLLLVALVIAAACRPSAEESLAVSLPDLTDAHPKLANVVRTLEAELRREPDSANRWGELGMVLMAHGWTSEAMVAFEQAGELDPDNVRWPYLGGILLEAVDLKTAANVYAQAATIEPNYAPLRYRWAHVLIRLDRLEAAEEQLRAAVQLAPQSPHPLLALGRAAIDRQDFAAARAAFQQATGVAPFCREARELLARAHFLLGNQAQAERDQQFASSLPPAFPGLADPIFQEVQQRELVARQSAQHADQLVASGDMAAAATAFQRLIEDRPDLSRPRLNLAALVAMQGDTATAITMYREIIRLFPDEALAQQGLAGELARAGNIGGAINAYQECLRLKPDFAQARHALGLLWEQQGDLEQAIEAYRAAITADAQYAPAYLALGLAHQRQGDHDAAVAAMENAVRLAPHDAVPRNHLRRARQAQQAARIPADGQ